MGQRASPGELLAVGTECQVRGDVPFALNVVAAGHVGTKAPFLLAGGHRLQGKAQSQADWVMVKFS